MVHRPGPSFVNDTEWVRAGAGVLRASWCHKRREVMWRFSWFSCYHVLGSGGFSEACSLEDKVNIATYSQLCLLDRWGRQMTKDTLYSLSKSLTLFFMEWQLWKYPLIQLLSFSNCAISNKIASMKLFHCHMNHSSKNGPGNPTPPLQLKFMDIRIVR